MIMGVAGSGDPKAIQKTMHDLLGIAEEEEGNDLDRLASKGL